MILPLPMGVLYKATRLSLSLSTISPTIEGYGRGVGMLFEDGYLPASIIERYNSIVEEINSKGTGLTLYTDGKRR